MYQIFVKDRCTNNGKTYKIDVTSNTTMDEFKKKVFEKTNIPFKSQKFLYQTKYLNDDLILDQIYFDKKLNWACVDLMFHWRNSN